MFETNWVSILSYAVGLLGVIGGGVGFIRFGDYKTTVKLQNDNIKALRDQADIHESQLKEEREARLASDKALAALQGKLEAYKEIPLQSIAVSLGKIADSNTQILNLLSSLQQVAGGVPSISVINNPQKATGNGNK